MISAGAILLCLALGVVVCGSVVVGFVKLGEIWGWWGGEQAEPEPALPTHAYGIPIHWSQVVPEDTIIMVAPRPFDWAHRVGFLAPEDHYVTFRGVRLGTTRWPRG